MVRNYIFFFMLISVVQLNAVFPACIINILPAALQGFVGTAAGEVAKNAVSTTGDGKKAAQETIKDYYDPAEFKSLVLNTFKDSLSGNYGPEMVRIERGNYTVTRKLVANAGWLRDRKYSVTVRGANVERAGIMGTTSNMLASETEIDLGKRMAALMFADRVRVQEEFDGKEKVRSNPRRHRISEFFEFTHITDPGSYVKCTVDRSGGVNRPVSCSFEIHEKELDKLFASKK